MKVFWTNWTLQDDRQSHCTLCPQFAPYVTYGRWHKCCVSLNRTVFCSCVSKRHFMYNSQVCVNKTTDKDQKQSKTDCVIRFKHLEKFMTIKTIKDLRITAINYCTNKNNQVMIWTLSLKGPFVHFTNSCVSQCWLTILIGNSVMLHHMHCR